MKILVNATARDIQSGTLDKALAELGMTSPALATALNGNFVSRAKRADTQLSEGDRLEVLSPMQGG